MARPRKNTPDQVRAAVDRMIQEYTETNDIDKLSDFHLLELLGNISVDTLERYYNGKADAALLDSIDNNNNNTETETDYIKSGYTAVLKRLIEYRRQVCVRNIAGARNGSTITGWIFLSKQPHYGGLTDVQRTETRGEQKFTICIADSTGQALKE